MEILMAVAFLAGVVLAQISTVNYQVYKMGMIVMNPIMEIPFTSSVNCALHCDSLSSCYAFSLKTISGGVNCRLSGWKPQLAPDPNSDFFIGEIPSGGFTWSTLITEYLPVANSTRYVKMVYETLLVLKNPSYLKKNWNESQEACKADGGWLVIDNDDIIRDYLFNFLMANGIFPGYRGFWVGGYSTFDKWHWVLLDGTQMNLTGLGQWHFAVIQPAGTGGCLQFFAKYDDVYCCGLWKDYPCSLTNEGYLCEIQLL